MKAGFVHVNSDDSAPMNRLNTTTGQQFSPALSKIHIDEDFHEELLCDRQNKFVSPGKPCGILKGLQDVFTFKVRKIGKEFFDALACIGHKALAEWAAGLEAAGRGASEGGAAAAPATALCKGITASVRRYGFSVMTFLIHRLYSTKIPAIRCKQNPMPGSYYKGGRNSKCSSRDLPRK
jgi:hypothetical protein